MTVSFLPFPTRLVAEAIRDDSAERAAADLLGACLLVIALLFSALWGAVALDRALLWGHYVVPNYYIDTWRVAHWTHLKRPHRTPRYDVGLMSWWIEGSAPTPAPDEVAE